MDFHIDVDGVSDSKAKASIENAIRECLGGTAERQKME